MQYLRIHILACLWHFWLGENYSVHFCCQSHVEVKRSVLTPHRTHLPHVFCGNKLLYAPHTGAFGWRDSLALTLNICCVIHSFRDVE